MMMGRAVVVWPAVLALRALAGAAFSAGIGAFGAWVVSRSLGKSDAFEWAASLPPFALTLSIALLVTSVAATTLLPDRAALVRNIRGEYDPPLGHPLIVLLALLCGLAILQVPAAVGWAREEYALIRGMLPGQRDPLGLDVIPIVVALFLPSLTLLTLGLFLLTSLLTVFAPSRFAFRVIAAGVALQLGYIGAIVLSSAEIRTLASALTSAVGPDDMPQALIDWIQRHDAGVARAIPWIIWTSVGYLFAAGVAYYSTKDRGPSVVSPTPATKNPVTEAPRVAQPPVSHASAASAAIDESTYSVHPQMTLVESWFTRRCTTFEIRTVPPRSRKWFSFSWTSGALRQEPDGIDLVVLRPPSAPGLFLSRAYEAIDAKTKETLARFEPRGADWEIVDAAGAPLGRILRESSGLGPVKYRAFVGDDEVVRYKWALAGLTAASAQLEVELLSPNAREGSHHPLDRILAIAIAPILEQRARIANERSMPSR